MAQIDADCPALLTGSQKKCAPKESPTNYLLTSNGIIFATFLSFYSIVNYNIHLIPSGFILFRFIHYIIIISYNLRCHINGPEEIKNSLSRCHPVFFEVLIASEVNYIVI